MPLIEVSNARFRPCMDSFLGAAHGLLAALDDEQDIEDLWGLSSLALRTQVHRTLDPLGLLPAQWDVTLARWLRNFGHDCSAGLRDHFYTDQDLRELQAGWMRNVEKALQDGRPALSFGLHGPAFGLINGFDPDAEEYRVSTFLDGRRDTPINVQDVGSIKPPLIFFLIPTGPVSGHSYVQSARDAIKEALDQHLGRSPADTRDDIITGPAAYNAWSTAIETGIVHPHWGAGLYAAYFTEARSAAADWLRRLAARPEFESAQVELGVAVSHLEHETECLVRLAGLFPLNEPEALNDIVRRTEASACLRLARSEHIAAMEALLKVSS